MGKRESSHLKESCSTQTDPTGCYTLVFPWCQAKVVLKGSTDIFLILLSMLNKTIVIQF